MTNLANAFDAAFKDFGRFYVGTDDLINRLAKIQGDVARGIPTYPPYNIKKTDDYNYLIEIAVAGFNKSDIDIELKEDSLIVSGKTDEDSSAFLYKGIANRAFTRSFTLNDQIVVNDADLVNGMLRIYLEKIIPEHKKTRKILVKDEAKLLTE